MFKPVTIITTVTFLIDLLNCILQLPVAWSGLFIYMFNHSRNPSVLSTSTVHGQGTSQASHTTTVPLLHDSPVVHPTPQEWNPGFVLYGNAPIDPQQNVSRRGSILTRRRLKRLRWTTKTLELAMGAWSVYNTIRYFIAFTIFDSSQGQVVSLALGTCTGASFAFFACAAILSLFQSCLLAQRVPLRSIIFALSGMHYLSSFFLLAPAITNFVLTFTWRTIPDDDLKIASRCHIDIDVIWSVRRTPCNHSPAWGFWLTASTLRLAATLLIMVIYHSVDSVYHRIRCPSKTYNNKRPHYRKRSDSFATSLPPPFSQLSSGVTQTNSGGQIHHHSSGSTLFSQYTPKKGAYAMGHRLSKHKSASVISTSEMTAESSTQGHSRSDFSPTDTIKTPTILQTGETDDLNGFVDRFCTLVNQIERETEDALDFAQSDNTSSNTENSTTTSESVTSTEPGFLYPHPIPPAVGFNEFGMPYPPEEEVRMLNGYIRRMPTIESMGSREWASSIGGTSSIATRDRIGSRPTTRDTLQSIGWTEYSSNEPHSRANSLSARAAEVLNGNGSSIGPSEVGELRAGRWSPTVPGGGAQEVASHPESGINQSTAASRSTMATYHTAAGSSMMLSLDGRPED